MNQNNLQDYGFLQKWIATINSTHSGEKFIKRLRKVAPCISDSPNHISWMWNKLRKPDKYREFADKRKWVFILGCSNSGTTLLHHLLSSHPDIATLPDEGQFYTKVLPSVVKGGLPRVWTEDLDTYRMTETDRQYDSLRMIHDWKNFLSNVSAPAVLEKSPPNTIRSRWLQSIFENSFFIGLVRDGRAVAEGINRRSWIKGINFDRTIAHWIKANTLMLDDAKQLKNFQLVRYEDLAENPKKTILELIRFIGEDPEKYKFDFDEKIDIHNIKNEPNTIKNFNQKSFDRIPPDTFKMLTTKIKPMMERLGYKV